MSKQTYYRCDATVSTFYKEIRNIAQDLLNIEKKTYVKFVGIAKHCHICKKVFGKTKKHIKVRDPDHYTRKYRGAAHLICNLRYSTQIDIPVFFHNVTDYDFNLIINELAKEFRSEMRCIPLNTNKYISFSIPIRKEIKEEQKEQKKKVITYNLKFIDSAKHMNSALSTLVNNLSEINKCKCEEDKDKRIKIKIKKVNSKERVITSCKTCNSKESQLVSELIKKFPNTYKLCDKSSKKFILLLKKGEYPYEDMDSMDRFDETTLPNIEKFYSKLQLKDISEKDYKHAKKVWNIFEIKTLGEYHDLYVQADTAQLSDVFESFRSFCLKEYQLDPAYFVSTPSLANEAMLKITKAKIDLGGLTQVI